MHFATERVGASAMSSRVSIPNDDDDAGDIDSDSSPRSLPHSLPVPRL